MGGKLGEGDFVVDTGEHCFLCLAPVSSSLGSDKSMYSLQELTRYLEMGISQVNNGSRLKARLCEECALIGEGFSDMYQQLDRIKMGMLTCLNFFHRKLTQAKEDRVGADLTESDSISSFADALRNEAEKKCFRKLKCCPPRVKLRKLTEMEAGVADRADDDDMNCEETDEDSSEEPPNPAKETAPPFKNWYEFNRATGKFSCLLCPMETSYRNVVLKHYRGVHLKIKHECPSCPKKFSQRASYRRHIISVHQGQRHNCTHCQKSFGRKDLLNLHIRGGICKRRDPSKPRKVMGVCSYCGREFSDAGNLRTHYRLVHKELAGFGCDLCGRKFEAKRGLNFHLKEVHPKEFKNEQVKAFIPVAPKQEEEELKTKIVVESSCDPEIKIEIGEVKVKMKCPNSDFEEGYE